MKKITLLLFLCVSLNTIADQPLFTKANTAYASDSITKAIALYDSILARGRESSELYYNLGNCYYKNKDWANAIWHYEKSLKIEQNEKTIQNLALVNLKLIDRIEPLPELFYKKWLKSISQLFNTKFWQILTLICVWLFLLVRIFASFTTYKKDKLSHALLLIAILLLFIANFSYTNTIAKKEGIIFSSTVIVNSAPTPNSADLFSLHAGVKVEVVDEIGDWINIKLTNGNTGWVKKNSCKVL